MVCFAAQAPLAAPACVAVLEGHSGRTKWVKAVAFSPDGAILATGSGDNTVKLWDVASRRCLATLEGHGGLVYSVAFSRDGATLATASRDKTARLWGVASRQCVATL